VGQTRQKTGTSTCSRSSSRNYKNVPPVRKPLMFGGALFIVFTIIYVELKVSRFLWWTPLFLPRVIYIPFFSSFLCPISCFLLRVCLLSLPRSHSFLDAFFLYHKPLYSHCCYLFLCSFISSLRVISIGWVQRFLLCSILWTSFHNRCLLYSTQSTCYFVLKVWIWYQFCYY